MKRYKVLAIIMLVSVATFLVGCGEPSTTEKNELLIYCGVTMAQPMEEIAAIIEKQENCNITIQAGGSGSLLRTLQADQVGDLYLPADDSYIVTCLEQDLVLETALVGYNRLALLVQEGNPLGITAEPASLMNEEYVLILGAPAKMSAGREAQKVLANMRVFDPAMGHVSRLAPTAIELTDALKNGEADLTISWHAFATWPENAPYIDALPISEEYVTREKLVIGLLSTSESPELARKFMEYAASDAGRALFDKYGLGDVE